MEVFEEFLTSIDNPDHRNRMEEVLTWVLKEFPDLVPVIKWNQPMFTDHGTYIIGFSVSKKHMAAAPEKVTMEKFSTEIGEAGYEHTKELVRIPWNGRVDFSLLEKMIKFNVQDKADYTDFWRK